MIKIAPFIVSSILISLAINFPQNLSFLSLVFLIPILSYIKKNQIEKTLRVDVARMFLFGFLFMFLSSLWFIDAYPLDWLGVNDKLFSFFTVGLIFFMFCFISSIPISFWVIFVHVFKKSSFFINSIIGASSWILLEYLRSFVIAFSVYGNETLLGPHYTNSSLGYTVFNIPIIKELLPVGGMYLASFVVVLINYLLYGALFEFKIKSKKKDVLILLMTIIIIITSSFFIINKIRENNSLSKTIIPTVVTTYLPSTSNKYLEEYKKNIASFALKKINKEVSDTIIIFPENINPLENDLENRNNLIIGSFKNKLSYNQFFWDTSNSNIEYYEKQLLMPVGEYDIYLLRYTVKLFGYEKWDNIYKNYRRVSKSSDNNTFVYKNDDYYISGSICSENISPYIHSKPVLNGSNLIINILSHAPFHDSYLLPKQTLAISSTRALENGRYFITASNYDKSSVITDKGVLLITSVSKEVFSSFETEVILKNYITPYVKYGDYIIYASGLFMLVNIFVILRKRKVI